MVSSSSSPTKTLLTFLLSSTAATRLSRFSPLHLTHPTVPHYPIISAIPLPSPITQAFKIFRPYPRPRVTFCVMLIFLGRGVVRPTFNQQAGRPPLFCGSQLFIQDTQLPSVSTGLLKNVYFTHTAYLRILFVCV